MELIQAIEEGVKGMAFAPSANLALLEQDDLVWFNELKNQYKSLEPLAADADPVKMAARNVLNPVIGKPTAELKGQDLADLETWLIELLPPDDLRQKVNSLRDDLREMAGDDCWAKILPTLTNQVATAEEKPLRAEARRLQQELHWRASIQPEAQKLRVLLMLKVIATFTAILICALLLVLCKFSSFGDVVMVAGALGALISCIQRIQSADLCSSRATSMAKGDRLTLGVTISPLLGGIFAVLLVLLLLTRQVSPGFVIPNVTVSCPPIPMDGGATNAVGGKAKGLGGTIQTEGVGKGTDADRKLALTSTGTVNVAGMMTNTTNTQTEGKEAATVCKYDFFTLKLSFASGQDLALLILWAFIAGFSERLVPDLLTRMADAKKG